MQNSINCAKNKQRIIIKSKFTENENCSICLSSMYHTTILITPCGHLFHHHCLNMVFTSETSLRYHCPLCRTNVYHAIKFLGYANPATALDAFDHALNAALEEFDNDAALDIAETAALAAPALAAPALAAPALAAPALAAPALAAAGADITDEDMEHYVDYFDFFNTILNIIKNTFHPNCIEPLFIHSDLFNPFNLQNINNINNIIICPKCYDTFIEYLNMEININEEVRGIIEIFTIQFGYNMLKLIYDVLTIHIFDTMDEYLAYIYPEFVMYGWWVGSESSSLYTCNSVANSMEFVL
jgi:hypothetical protein